MNRLKAGVWAALLAIAPWTASARDGTVVLRANSALVDVQDGQFFLKGGWVADPTLPLDVYDARRSDGVRRITLTSDVEAVSFDVEPGRVYDFDVVLAGRTTCHTRISTMKRSGQRAGTAAPDGPVTIPITISRGKLHVTGRVNGSSPLDLIFDTGADICVLYPSATAKGAALRFDGTISNSGTGGTTVRRLTREGVIEVGGLRFEHEPVMFIEKQADEADGIAGYSLFENKNIEIDYDRMVMLVHDALPAHAAGFSRTDMQLSGTLTAVEAELVNGAQRSRGMFLLDTGGSGALLVNQAFATAHDLRGTMPRLGTSTSRGVGSGVVRNDVMLLPELRIAGFAVANVPIDVEVPTAGDHASPGGALCMEVLQRFNTILDYPGNSAYFRPNARFATPFSRRTSGPPIAWWVGAATAIVAGLVAAGVWKSKRAA